MDQTDDENLWCPKCETTHPGGADAHDASRFPSGFPHGLPPGIGIIKLPRPEAIQSPAMVCFMVLMIPVWVAMDGWVVKTVWNWTLVRPFGQPWGLSLGAGMGLVVIARLLTGKIEDPQRYYTSDQANEAYAKTAIIHVGVLVTSLFLGWLAS